jgi:ketosteroid isomerase-like protein
MVFQSMKYSDVEVIEGADENVAVAFAHADAVLPNGSPYAQDYVFYFGLDAEGKIAAYREYMNTELQSKAFAALAAAM